MSLPPEAKAALSAARVSLAFFAELDFSTGAERFWNGLHALEFEGKTWLPTGKLAGVSEAKSSEDFRANGISLSIAGIPSAQFATMNALRSEHYKGRAARFIVAIMDAGFSRVLHAIPRYFTIDRIDYEISAEQGAACTVSLENSVIRASRNMVKRYSAQDQERRFSGDKSLEFVNYIASGVEIKWGTKGAFFPPK